MRTAEGLDAEVALGARILAHGTGLEAAAVKVALAARVLPHVTAQHLLPKVVRRRAGAEETAAAEGWRGAGRVLQPCLPLAPEGGARIAVDRAVIEEEEAAHHLFVQLQEITQRRRGAQGEKINLT